MKQQKPWPLPVSQRALAAYLGISSTLLSMTNTGRHGPRQLGNAQSKKMADLLLAHLQSQRTNAPSVSIKKMQKRSTEDCARLAKEMLVNANYAATHLSRLELQLDEIARNQQQDTEWLHTVDYLLTRLSNSRESANDRIWLQNQQVIVLKRLQKNGSQAQVKLETQIEMEKARARIYRDALKKLQKK